MSERAVQDRAIILRTRPLREADLLVTMVSQHEGKLVGVASNARRSRKRFGGCLELGLTGQVEYIHLPGESLVRLNHISLVSPPPRIAGNLSRFAGLGLMVTLADKMWMERQESATKFAILSASLAALETGEPSRVCLNFIHDWLESAGFAPVVDNCSCCHRSLERGEQVTFVPSDGGTRCEKCGASRQWSIRFPEELRQVWQSCGVGKQPGKALSTPARSFFSKALWQYLNHILDRPLPLAAYWPMIWSDHA